MKIQIYKTGDALEACDLLIAKEEETITFPIAGLKDILKNISSATPVIIGEKEPFAMKAAIVLNEVIKESEEKSILLSCSDKELLSQLANLTFLNSLGKPVRIDINGKAKEQAPVTRRKKPKEELKTKGNTEEVPGKRTGRRKKETVSNTGEVLLPETQNTDDSDTRYKNSINQLKKAGITDKTVALAVSEAIEKSTDASITFPMQVKLMLAMANKPNDESIVDSLVDKALPVYDKLKKILK